MNRNSAVQQNNSESRKENRGLLLRQETSFSGPLPPPETLKKFDEVVPGAAERIIKMAEGQFVHRTELEKLVIKSDVEQSKRGQLFGFAIAVIGFVTAIIAILNGEQWAAGIMGGATLATLAGVFVYGSRSRSKEREEKEKAEDK